MPETIDDLITEFAGRIADRGLLHGDDGGAAYPFSIVGEVALLAHPGMSLRDYFAARAMQSIFAGPGARDVADRDSRYNEANWAEVVAANAYEMADAMLRRRKLTSKGEKHDA